MMAQITSGVHAILSHPYLYSAFQNLMGARKKREEFARDFIRPQEGCAILDIGCGPAEILDCLPFVHYWGFDISPSYIKKAKARFGKRGHFFCKEMSLDSLAILPEIDIVLAIGVLHHLDDSLAESILQLARHALRPGGRFVSLDPCLVDGQNRIARFLIQHDRGQNVRRPEQYYKLVSLFFSDVRGEVRHQTWIPYTHFLMECTRS